VGFGLACLRDYIANLSVFAERLTIDERGKVPNQIYHRVEDHISVVVKSKPLSEHVEKSQIDNEIEDLINQIESESPQELKIVRLYLEACSLLEVVSVNPVWWTSRIKAKAIPGIVLALRFAHSLGLLQGHLTTSNIIFDSDHCIQIVDVKPTLLDVGERKERTRLGGFSGQRWTPEKDVQAFASILSEVLFGGPPKSEASIPTGIPNFVSEIIESALDSTSKTRFSFNAIFEILKQNDFRIENDVDSAEASAFVNSVESAEPPEKYTDVNKLRAAN
jgi:hypothetical protein